MSLLVPARVDIPELLDEDDAPGDDVERSLTDLRRINRWLGGIAVYRRLLARLGIASPRLLDVGTGTSDLLLSVPEASLRVGVDLKIEHLVSGRRRRRTDEPQVHLVVADAAFLPFRSGAVDVVTSAHFFHHFSPDENRAILAESLRVARHGVAVNDTERHLVPLLFVRLISLLRLVGRITRFDAPASVLRAYTREELEPIAGSCAASRFEIARAFPFRVGMLLWK